MATTRPFAYNTGSTIDGTNQVGNIAIGVSDQDYSLNPGGVKWWMGPDEELGYVIAHEASLCDQPTPVEVDACLGFWRSDVLTEQSFVDLFNIIPPRVGQTKFTSGNSAKTWLNDNGYWTSYGNPLVTPTPTATSGLPTATPSPTSEPTSTPTPTPTDLPATPTPTATGVPSSTSTPTPTATGVPAPTSTPTPTATNIPSTPTPTATGVPAPTSTPTATAISPTATATSVSSTPTPTPTNYPCDITYNIINTTPTPTNSPCDVTYNIVDTTPTPTPTTYVPGPGCYTFNITNKIGTRASGDYIDCCDGLLKHHDTQPGETVYGINSDSLNGWGVFYTLTNVVGPYTCGGPTPTPTATSIPPTPTPTATSIPPTSTPTPTATSVSPTPTATSTSAPMTVTITEVGSNVVMSASGTINLSGLTLVNPSFGPVGGGGLGTNTATFVCGNNNTYANTYSGFTSVPSNFGSGSGAANSSASGDLFGIIYLGAPPHFLLVPTGYTSGTNITSTQTFNNTTLSTLGLTNGTYTYTWSGGSIDIVIGTGLGGPTPTPTATSSGGGMGSWYFYYTEGPLMAGPPTGNGNAIFRNLTDATQVFEPNFSNGTGELYFCTKDSSGTSFNTQFSNLQTYGGTITITQGSNSAIFTSPTGNNFVYNPGGGGTNGFLMIRSSQNITQTQTCSKFNGTDPISLSFS
jgi:hypothetical protein